MPLRCFIVDDSEEFLATASRVLERGEIRVVGTASTAEEALRGAAELRPDVMLVDIDLGGESGFELVRRLREDARAGLPRVILISTHDEDEFADLIEASSASGFLTKARLSEPAIRALLAAGG